MIRVIVVTLAVATLAVTFASTVGAADPPAHRVIAMYFHRTERCPTCLKMGSYSEEAVKKGFTKQIKALTTMNTILTSVGPIPMYAIRNWLVAAKERNEFTMNAPKVIRTRSRRTP